MMDDLSLENCFVDEFEEWEEVGALTQQPLTPINRQLRREFLKFFGEALPTHLSAADKWYFHMDNKLWNLMEAAMKKRDEQHVSAGEIAEEMANFFYKLRPDLGQLYRGVYAQTFEWVESATNTSYCGYNPWTDDDDDDDEPTTAV
ncbi:protein ORF69 [Anguillid herpesvirus 1]|uniref:Protein ORF69 n=1 Tax=Anguillid herpesvirus 1 TaxID=150286 RepID=A0A1J0REM0_9VIRU|nr:protein ORF69 [Anguillid herpesvirus 1]ADA57832.2 protein ORF69 [Anguillid herpesvirus 1]APD76232.1 ORF69 [Anguillid herpesvirus 1]QRM16363.1 protein ORF69 [Anguillid herpesvirus 1]QRM16492.1 protein ORF69 [Anguillid herpesvirus 1]QRM16622.1 protein ORF69 [Anguillid herpesvirus 1]